MINSFNNDKFIQNYLKRSNKYSLLHLLSKDDKYILILNVFYGLIYIHIHLMY